MKALVRKFLYAFYVMAPFYVAYIYANITRVMEFHVQIEGMKFTHVEYMWVVVVLLTLIELAIAIHVMCIFRDKTKKEKDPDRYYPPVVVIALYALLSLVMLVFGIGLGVFTMTFGGAMGDPKAGYALLIFTALALVCVILDHVFISSKQSKL